jgi:hypothetical protein
LSLLPRHGDAEAFVAVDEVIVVVLAEVDLHPVDPAGEPAGRGGVVAADRGAGLVADVESASVANSWMPSTVSTN